MANQKNGNGEDYKKLIGNIDLTLEKIRPGESTRIEIFDPKGNSLTEIDNTTVYINGIEGALQHLQFITPGEQVIQIRAVRNGTVDRSQKVVNVVGDPLLFRRNSHDKIEEMTVINADYSLENPYKVTFTLGDAPVLQNGKASNPINTSDVLDVTASDLRISDIIRSVNSEASEITESISELKANNDVQERFEWDFGDGTTASTSEPKVTHDYSDSLDAHHKTKRFHVRCRINSDDIEVVRTLAIHSAYVFCKEQGTIVPPVDSDTYAETGALNFQATMTVSNIEDVPLTITHKAVQPRAGDNDGIKIPNFKPLSQELKLPANSATTIGTHVGPSLPFLDAAFTVYYAGSAPNGTPVRFSAPFYVESNNDRERHRIPDLEDIIPDPYDKLEIDKGDLDFGPVFDPDFLPDIFKPDIIDPDKVKNIADELRTDLQPGRSFDLFIDDDASTIAVSSTKEELIGPNAPLRTTAREIVRGGFRPMVDLPVSKHLTKANIDKDKNPEMPPMIPLSGSLSSSEGPPEPGPVEEGEVCVPVEITPAEQEEAEEKGLACQVTQQKYEVTPIPGRFMNARKGDILLSPGGAGLIANLLRHVEPAQYYSHCGIMTSNFDEVTHSTASAARLTDASYRVSEEILGVEIPETEGSEGIRPDVLKYMWPGPITQTAQASVEGEQWKDPENGKEYTISGFYPYTRGSQVGEGALEVAQGVVIKPDPKKIDWNIRKALHQVADEAHSIGGRPNTSLKGHYRLYCYTDPTIGLNSTAPEDAGWAAGTSPSVCSSFIWELLWEAGLHLEADTKHATVADIEDKDEDMGASVSAGTEDGLYHYTAEERQAAANWLYNAIVKRARLSAGKSDLKEAGIWFFDSDDEVANQVCNTFASDDAQHYGWDNESWKETGDATAVSPDNIRWWDSLVNGGYYGYMEPLQYDGPHKEKHAISRWTTVETAEDENGEKSEKDKIKKSKITGRVTAEGKDEPVENAHVLIGSNKVYTDSDGEYEITSVPFPGSYELRSWKTIDGWRYAAKKIVSVNEPTENFGIELQPPPKSDRLITIQLDFHGVDDEIDWAPLFGGNPDQTLDRQNYTTFTLDPTDPRYDYYPPEYAWGDELLVDFDFHFVLLPNKKVEMTIKGRLWQGTDSEKSGVDNMEIHRETVKSGNSLETTVKLESGDSDYAELVVTVQNLRQSV